MIVAISTSSPVVSVAIFDQDDGLHEGRSVEANRNASGGALRLLDELLDAHHLKIENAKGFIADIGPGSFTGVKVGVTLAKTFAFACGCEVAGITSFDLVSPTRTVALPSKRGEWFVRHPNEPPMLSPSVEKASVIGYGFGSDSEVFPDAKNAADLFSILMWTPPEMLLANYVLPPSISMPKIASGSEVSAG